MLVSKNGFFDVLGPNVRLDPSRVAAQIVTGIGFIGGGLIFVRRDVVRGLTTAAIVWLTAAVGMACGAGLVLLAIAATAGHFIVVYVYPFLARRVPGAQATAELLRVVYQDGSGALAHALAECTQRGFTVDDVAFERSIAPDAGGLSAVTLRLRGTGSRVALTAAIAEIAGVVSLDTGEGPSE
jgi:putative Mg2+ transporter-C (MgtC) family protein